MLMRLLVLSINEHVMTECELCRHCVAGCYLVKTYHWAGCVELRWLLLGFC